MEPSEHSPPTAAGRKRQALASSPMPKAKFSRRKTGSSLSDLASSSGSFGPEASPKAQLRKDKSGSGNISMDTPGNGASSSALSTMLSSSTLGVMLPPAGPVRNQRKVPLSVSNACVEFTRDLFMEVMRDGAVSETERRLLQCCVAIMSQMDEKFGDSGERISIPVVNVQDMCEHFPASEEFMKKVAKDLDRHFAKEVKKGSRKTKQEDNSVGAQLARQLCRGLAACTGTHANVTGEQLLGCCEGIDEVDTAKEFGWVTAYILESVSRLMPDAYMFKERLAELYLQRQFMTQRFLSDAFSFLLACLLYTVIKAWLGLVASILQIRVFLCFATWLPLLGHLFSPLCKMAEKVFEWREDHWLLGCLEMDGQQSSLISVLPVWFSRNVVVALVTRPEFVLPCALTLSLHWCRLLHRRFLSFAIVLLSAVAGHALELYFEELPSELLGNVLGTRNVRFGVEFIMDFLFTSCLCSLDRNVLQAADDVMQPKLVLMSVKLGSQAASLELEAAESDDD